MDETIVTSEPSSLRFTTKYIRKLIVEAPYIYERLYNPSGSIILHQHMQTPSYMTQYSTSIGNSFHNDLIDVSIILKERFTKEEIKVIYDWATGLNSKQAADYYGVTGNVVRKRRQRIVHKLRREIDGYEQKD
jgi:DNA-binding NarL/FixJ family response regulator